MYRKLHKSGLTEIIPFILSYQSEASTSWVPQCSPLGVASAWRLLDLRYYSLSWVPSGLTDSSLDGWNRWWQWHPCLLIQQMVKNLPAMQETWVQSLGWEDPLEKGMATHSSILAWRIPWTQEPSSLQSMESQWVRYDWATNITILIR